MVRLGPASPARAAAFQVLNGLLAIMGRVQPDAWSRFSHCKAEQSTIVGVVIDQQQIQFSVRITSNVSHARETRIEPLEGLDNQGIQKNLVA